MTSSDPSQPDAPGDSSQAGDSSQDGTVDASQLGPSLETLLADAKQLIATRSYDEAIRTCRQALLKDPTLVRFRLLLGMALLALERHDEARAEMRAILKQDPQHADAHRLLGEGYLRAGQTKEARAILRQTLELAPDDTVAQDLLNEVEEEDVPVIATVDRWFDPVNLATKQSSLPPWQPGTDTSPVAPAVPTSTAVDPLFENPTAIGPAPVATADGETGAHIVDELIPEAPSEEALSTLASGLEQLAEAGLPPLAGEATVASATDFWLPEEGHPDATPHAARQTPPQGASLGFRTKVVFAAALLTAGILGVALAVLAVSTLLPAGPDREIRVLLGEACRTGLSGPLSQAVELGDEALDESGEATALRARLLAMSMLEQRSVQAQAAARLLGTLSEQQATSDDARIAKAILALAGGTPSDALHTLEGAQSNADGEIPHLRAMATLRLGRSEDALRHATEALAEHAGAPRRLATLMMAQNQMQRQGQALETVLSADDPDNPLLASVQSDALFGVGKEHEGFQLATAVSGDSRAPPSALALARLVRARFFLSEGRTRDARSEARKALEHHPLGDEAFLLAIGETFLAAQDRVASAEVASNLPAEVANLARRNRLLAEVAAADGRLDDVERLLNDPVFETEMPASSTDGSAAQIAYLRGRVALHRGYQEKARNYFQAAARAPSQYTRSMAELGSIALGRGDTAGAIAFLTPAYERAPDVPAVVVPYVKALLEQSGDIEKATAVLTSATRLRPHDMSLLSMQARLLVAKGRYQDAHAALSRLRERAPGDLEVLFLYAQSAERLGETDAADAAYQRLAQTESYAAHGMHGLFRLALANVAFSEAEKLLERASLALPEAEVAWLNATLLVYQGKGAAALAAVDALPEADDAVRRNLLKGEAAFQAERDRVAEEAFRTANSLDGDNIRSLVGLAGISLRRGSAGRAASRIAAARRALAKVEQAQPSLHDWPRGHAMTEALVLASEGRLAFENGQFDAAATKAREALARDPHCASAHYLLAELAIESQRDPTEHYRRTIAGRSPPPEAYAQLALRVSRQEACTLAATYLARAPKGIDARAMRARRARCR